jgi:Mannosyl-glycoprotein endo-beta-N-acetylglucosaminidase
MTAIPRLRLPLFLLLKLFAFVLLLLLVGMPLQAHADSSLPNTAPPDYSVSGPPTVNATLINRVLAAYHSPAAGKGQALYDDGVNYGIDPVFALAFFLHESTFGTAGVALVTHSLGNIRCTPHYSSCFQGYRAYTSWEDSFLDWYNLIGVVYIPSGLTTVEQIVPVYAPATENDVYAYITAVEQAVDTWRAAAKHTTGPWSTPEITVQKVTVPSHVTPSHQPARRTRPAPVKTVTVPLQVIPQPGQQQDDGNDQPVQLP